MALPPEIIARLAQTDPDRVRAAQLATPEDRDALMVLYAFHAELAKVPELVSEPLIGQIRYQWWRDALDEVYSGKPPRKHEVVLPLAEMIAERDVPRFGLDQLIDGRARDLDPRPFADIEAAKDYARTTSGRLMQTAAGLLGVEDERIVQAGEAWGLMGLARSWRFYKGSMLQHLDASDLAEAAEECLGRAAGKLPAAAIPATAYAALVPLYGRAVSRPGHDPATDKVEVGALRKQARLMRAAMTGKIA